MELPPPTATWKRYRGGQTQPIKFFDLTSYETTEVPFENDNCSCPCWVDTGVVYFISDRSGSANVFSYDPSDSAARPIQLTQHSEEDVKWLSFTAGASTLCYSQAGRLHLLPLGSSAVAVPLKLKLLSDFRHTRSGFRAGSITGASISPSGVRAAVTIRGEVLTVPLKHGGVRNISTISVRQLTT